MNERERKICILMESLFWPSKERTEDWKSGEREAILLESIDRIFNRFGSKKETDWTENGRWWKY